MSEHAEAAARRRRLTELLIRERGLVCCEGVVPVLRTGTMRASLAQERMWFWDRVTWPRSFLHNVPLAARLRGHLDVAALRSAVATLVARQESLRTSFVLEGPVVVQRIEDQVDVPLRIVDLSASPDPWAACERFCLEEVRELFDITRTPLLRTTLVRLADDDHVLVVTAHHIVWDGWSTGLLVYELSMGYRRALGLAPPLPDLPVRYADWAAWQHRDLTAVRLASHTAFWVARLAGVRTVHLAPALRPPESRVTDRGMTMTFAISPELTCALAAIGRKEDSTLFMVLLAGLTAVLHGLSGEDDVTVGGLIANRTTAQIGGVIGYFVNTVPIRSQLSSERTFLDHLRHIRAAALDAFEYQALPIGRIARAVADRRPEGWEQPLYSIDFMLQTAERPEPDFGAVDIEIPDFNTRTADYDMGCMMWQRTSDLSKSKGLHCWWEWKTDLFDECAIRTLIRRLVATLELVAGAPLTAMAELPPLDDGERERAIVRGAPAAQAPEDAVDAIRRHAHARAAAHALVGSDEATFTYGSLSAAIDQATSRLTDDGVGPGAVVTIGGVTPPRGLVTALAVLACGAAFRVADSEADPTGGGQDTAQVLRDAEPDGAEVEVLVSRRALQLAVANAQGVLRLGSADVVASCSPLPWDADAWLLLAALAAGAELRAGYDVGGQAPVEFAALLADGAVTVLHTVPSRLRDLIDAAKARRPARLRAVVVTGDRIPPALIRRWADELSGVELVAAFCPPGGAGPVTLHPLDSATFVTAPWDPIGLPLPGHATYLLDGRGRPVAPGATGHLFVGGDAIPRGYHGDPRRTAARFVPDPFSPRPGARMFATGARARRRHDGLLEREAAPPAAIRAGNHFVRPDQVDAALGKNPALRCSLTVPLRGPDDRWRLVSYVVPVAPAARSAEEALARAWSEMPAAPLLGRGAQARDPDVPIEVTGTHRLPGRTRLERSLAEAVRGARGGRVVLAAVRHLGLRRAALCVQKLAAARPDASFSSVREEVARALRHDPELAVAPGFLARTARALPRVSAVLVEPHRGADDGSPFLFDVSIDLDRPDHASTAPTEETTWPHDGGLAWFDEQLTAGRPVLVARGIPDHRVLAALAVERGFDETVSGASVEDMRRATAAPKEVIDPDAVASLALRHGYHAAFALEPDAPGAFAAALARRLEEARSALAGIGAAEPGSGAEPTASGPALVAYRWSVACELRGWLSHEVPAALHPSLVVVVDDLPELPNGRPDTHRLPCPGLGTGHRLEGSLEHALAQAFGDLTESLGVGRHDRLADLAAHPLVAAALAATLARAGHVDVSTADVIAASTVAELAARIRSRAGDHDVD